MCNAALPQPSRAVLRSCAIWNSAWVRSAEEGFEGFWESGVVGDAGCGLKVVVREVRTSCRRSGLLRRQASRISSRGLAP